MIQAGEVDLADTDAGKRPVIVVSREELNRGNWVVAVMVTLTHFAARSTPPHNVGIVVWILADRLTGRLEPTEILARRLSIAIVLKVS